MLIAHHITFSTYGFWLPNDPRGSRSTYVGHHQLYSKHGTANPTYERKSVASTDHDYVQRLHAKSSLKHPPFIINVEMFSTIGVAIEKSLRSSNVEIYACSVMPDHLHLLLGINEIKIPIYITKLKSLCTKSLKQNHDIPSQPLWARGYWNIHITDEDQLFNCIQYIQHNPVKDGYPPQDWSFISNPSL